MRTRSNRRGYTYSLRSTANRPLKGPVKKKNKKAEKKQTKKIKQAATAAATTAAVPAATAAVPAVVATTAAEKKKLNSFLPAHLRDPSETELKLGQQVVFQAISPARREKMKKMSRKISILLDRRDPQKVEKARQINLYGRHVKDCRNFLKIEELIDPFATHRIVHISEYEVEILVQLKGEENFYSLSVLHPDRIRDVDKRKGISPLFKVYSKLRFFKPVLNTEETEEGFRQCLNDICTKTFSSGGKTTLKDLTKTFQSIETRFQRQLELIKEQTRKEKVLLGGDRVIV